MKKDVAASVRERLLNLAKKTSRPFNEVLVYYGIERFLYRLGHSKFNRKFILKGALMLQVWTEEMARATLDIDFLGLTKNEPDKIAEIIKKICDLKSPVDDGLQFNSDSIVVTRIQEQEGYEGVRVRLQATLSNAKIPIQIDIGFGDPVVPAPKIIDYPALLDFPHPQIVGYPKESTIAEKIHAMVRFQMLNSRMKDFYDLWLLARNFDFDGKLLFSAIEQTFAANDADLDFDLAGLTANLKHDDEKQRQWEAFTQRVRLAVQPPKYSMVIHTIELFLLPLFANYRSKRPLPLSWDTPGPWKKRRK